MPLRFIQHEGNQAIPQPAWRPAARTGDLLRQLERCPPNQCAPVWRSRFRRSRKQHLSGDERRELRRLPAAGNITFKSPMPAGSTGGIGSLVSEQSCPQSRLHRRSDPGCSRTPCFPEAERPPELLSDQGQKALEAAALPRAPALLTLIFLLHSRLSSASPLFTSLLTPPPQLRALSCWFRTILESLVHRCFA